MTSSHHGLYAQGYTRATMGEDKGQRHSDMKLIPKTFSQFRLQSATRLHEAGIASNRISAMIR